MSIEENGPDRVVFNLRRREFLVMSSAAALGLAATTLQSDVLDSTAAPMPLLSVGFWNGAADDIRGASDKAFRRRVVPADRLVAADASLLQSGARVTIHGFWRSASYRTPLVLGLRARYPSPALSTDSPSLIAWSWRPDMRVSNQVRFDVPVSDTLDLTVERLHARAETPRRLRELFRRSDAAPRAEVASMSPEHGARGLKLRRGVYFFAVRENESENLPSWSSYSVLPGAASLDPQGDGVLRTSMGNAPSFSYLMLSVDAARV